MVKGHVTIKYNQINIRQTSNRVAVWADCWALGQSSYLS